MLLINLWADLVTPPEMNFLFLLKSDKSEEGVSLLLFSSNETETNGRALTLGPLKPFVHCCAAGTDTCRLNRTHSHSTASFETTGTAGWGGGGRRKSPPAFHAHLGGRVLLGGVPHLLILTRSSRGAGPHPQ